MRIGDTGIRIVWGSHYPWTHNVEIDGEVVASIDVETIALLKPLLDKARAAERERCAGVAEEYPSLEYANIAVVRGIAAAIRSLT